MAARLRRTFKYPDEDQDGPREELDEQEQERLIENLRKENNRQNAFYHTVFTIVPVAAAVAYVPSLLSTSSTANQIAILLCMASLGMTAYLMRFYHAFPTDGSRQQHQQQQPLQPGPNYASAVPVVLRVDTVLSAVLAGWGLLGWLSAGDADHQFALYFVPGFVFLVILTVRMMLLEVDLGQLERLKYPYKGA